MIHCMGSPDITAVISHMGAGGAQRVLSIAANEWARAGRNVEIVTLTDLRDDAFTLDPLVKRTRLITGYRRRDPNGSFSNAGQQAPRPATFGTRVANLCRVPLQRTASLVQYLRILYRLRSKMRADRPGVVLAFIAPTNVLTILACLGLQTRVVISERNDPSRQSFGLVWDFLRRLLYRRAGLVTANSEKALSVLAAYVPRSRLALLTNPVVLSDTKRRPKREARSVLSVGRIEPQKGYDVLLKAFAQVRSLYPDLHLNIAGAGSQLDEMRELCSRLSLGDAVTWHGQVHDMQPLYEDADIYVLSSLYEGTPNALLEAMNHSLPVIVTDRLDGAVDLVGEDRAGLVVPAGNPEALSMALERLISDSDLRKHLGDAARSKVRLHDVTKVMRQWDSILFATGPLPGDQRAAGVS